MFLLITRRHRLANIAGRWASGERQPGHHALAAGLDRGRC